MKLLILGRYFVPEDGDTEDHPNVFMLPKSTQSGSSPRLGDVKQAFPMPGKYHFRFKSPLIPGTDREKGAVSVWMDCSEDNQRVGVWKNSIFAKVTRINMDEDDDFDEEESDSGYQYATHHSTNGHARPGHDQIRKQATHEPTIAQMPVEEPVPAPVPEADILDVFDKPTPHHQTATQHPVSAASDSINLLDPHPSSLTDVHNNANGEGSLLNLDTTTYEKVDSASDFLGMTATAAPVQPTHATSSASQVQPAAPTYMSQPQHHPNIQNSNGNSFQTFASQNGPFGGLEWK